MLVPRYKLVGNRKIDKSTRERIRPVNLAREPDFNNKILIRRNASPR